VEGHSWTLIHTSLSGVRVGRKLDAILARRGKPLSIVSDNGTEQTSMAILGWSQEAQIDWHFIAPGNGKELAKFWEWVTSIFNDDLIAID